MLKKTKNPRQNKYMHSTTEHSIYKPAISSVKTYALQPGKDKEESRKIPRVLKSLLQLQSHLGLGNSSTKQITTAGADLDVIFDLSLC